MSGDWWRHFWLAFTKRGPYDPTGRDQELACLRAEVDRLKGEQRMRAHWEQRAREDYEISRQVHQIVGHRQILEEEDGRVRSSEELYAHLRSLMSHLHPTQIMEAQLAADARAKADRATLYANVRFAEPTMHRAQDDWEWDGDPENHPGPIVLTCCGRKPSEVGRHDAMTWDDARVTCSGPRGDAS